MSSDEDMDNIPISTPRLVLVPGFGNYDFHNESSQESSQDEDDENPHFEIDPGGHGSFAQGHNSSRLILPDREEPEIDEDFITLEKARKNIGQLAQNTLDHLRSTKDIFESAFFNPGVREEVLKRIGKDRKAEIFNFFLRKCGNDEEEAAYLIVIYSLLSLLAIQDEGHNDDDDLDELFDQVEPQIRETFGHFVNVPFSRKVLAQKFLNFIKNQTKEEKQFMSTLSSCELDLIKYIETYGISIENLQKDTALSSPIKSNPGITTKLSKGLRRYILPPYFRSHDGLLSAPMTFKFSDSLPYDRDAYWNQKQIKEFQNIVLDVFFRRRQFLIDSRYELLRADIENSPTKTILTLITNEPVRITRQIGIEDLEEWRSEQEARIYSGLVYAEDISIDKTNWMEVSTLMFKRKIRNMSDEECKSFWMEIRKSFSKLKRDWSKSDILTLLSKTDCAYEQDILQKGIQAAIICKCKSKCIKNHYYRNWNLIAKMMGDNLTPFECFQAYRNVLVYKHYVSLADKDKAGEYEEVRKGPNWNAVLTKTHPATSQLLPGFAYSLTEDALLLVFVCKLSARIEFENGWNSLYTYIPWRLPDLWKKRLRFLFSDRKPWSREEDLFVIKCVNAFGHQWAKIAAGLNSGKTRKGVRNRFFRLTKNLQYMENMRKGQDFYKVRRKRLHWSGPLQRILKLLKGIYRINASSGTPNFPGFERGRPPTENELRLYLVSRDQDLLRFTIFYIEKFLNDRSDEVDEANDDYVDCSKINRTTFIRKNPGSLASAMHVRGLSVKDLNEVDDPTDYEKQVLRFYNVFAQRKPMKRSIERKNIPSAEVLSAYPELRRILWDPIIKEKKKKKREKRARIEGVNENEPEVEGDDEEEEDEEEEKKKNDPFNKIKTQRWGRRTSKIKKMRALAAKMRWNKVKMEKEKNATQEGGGDECEVEIEVEIDPLTDLTENTEIINVDLP